MDSILHEDLVTVEDITPFLKQCVGKGKEIPPGSILQIQQITNISFPTYDKPSYDLEKHTLKLTVTDGNSQGYALIPDGCPGLSLNTAPGTKMRITQPVPVQGSLFVLTRNNCEVLGGRVVKLVEKWEQQKKLAIKHDWGYTGSSVEGEGPPAWKPFGYKPAIDVAALRKMKASDIVNEKKDGQPGGIKSQFDMQRDEAISELQGTASKQKFQKPNKHLVDKEITDIMDEGFSQTDAEYAMKRFKNPQKALKFLKESKNRQDGKEVPRPPVERKDRRRKGKGMDDEEEQDVPVEYRCPTKSTSLFAFIETKIKTDPEKPAQTNGPASRGHGDRSRDLEDGMGRLNIKESSESYSSYSRSDRGGRGGRGYRGRGDRGGGGITRDSYHQQQPRYENKPPVNNEVSQKPPRFQNRTGPDSRSTEYHHGSQRNQSNSNYDNYRGQSRDNYDTGVSRPYNTENSRQDNTSSYQSQHNQQQQQQPQRLPPGKDRSYSSEYYQQQQQYSSQQQSNDYAVPSQNYHHSYHQQQQHQQQQQQQHQQQQQQPPRQYMNASGQNQEYGNHRRGNQQRPQSHYQPNPSQGGHNQPPHSEFKQYQYGCDEWNPAQSLVFTRSKPDSRGRGGYQGGGRGATSHSAGRSYANRY